MATISSNYLTLTDITTRFDPDGKEQVIAELLSQTNAMLEDMPWVEGNLPTGHKTTIRTGIPAATWRLFYQGAQPTKSTTAQITDTCGMLETYSVIDKDLADLNGNSASFRMTEDEAFIEGMNQQFQQALIYSSVGANPERIQGLAPRFNTVQTAVANTANNVIDALGTTSTMTDIWLICWGPTTVHGIYPKGSRAGLYQEDVTTPAPVYDANGGLYQAYQTKYSWKCGLTVRDWRYIVRITNIDTSTSAGGLQSTTPPNLQRLMTRALNKIPNLAKGRPVFYVNRAVKTWAQIQAVEKTTNAFQSVQDNQGNYFTAFLGVPVKLCDQILSSQTQVT